MQVRFSGSKAIDRVVLYTLADNYAAGSVPGDAQTFTQFGVVDFTVQAWNGGAWVTLAAVTGNNLVKRTVTFPTVTTDRIRVTVTKGRSSYSRVVELEAWSGGGAASTPAATSTTLASSANPVATGASVTFTASVTGGAPTGSVGFTDNGGAIVGCGAVALAGSGNVRTAACGSSALAAGNHSIVATYGGDGANAGSASAALVEVVGGGTSASTNVALAANGGVASASSTFSAKYPLGAVIDGDRAGALWGNGGGWADATIDSFPDWLQVNFNGIKTLDRVVVYSLSDAYASGVAPSDTLTSSLYGARGLQRAGVERQRLGDARHRERQYAGEAHGDLRAHRHRSHSRERDQRARQIHAHRRARGLGPLTLTAGVAGGREPRGARHAAGRCRWTFAVRPAMADSSNDPRHPSRPRSAAPAPDALPKDVAARRHQMFPVLTDAEIARIARFGEPRHYQAPASACSPPASPAPACSSC